MFSGSTDVQAVVAAMDPGQLCRAALINPEFSNYCDSNCNWQQFFIQDKLDAFLQSQQLTEDQVSLKQLFLENIHLSDPKYHAYIPLCSRMTKIQNSVSGSHDSYQAAVQVSKELKPEMIETIEPLVEVVSCETVEIENEENIMLDNNSSQNAEVMTTKTVPITLYKVSREWLDHMFSEMRREVLTQAIDQQCPAAFLEKINSLQLAISDRAEISLHYPECQRGSPNIQVAAAPVAGAPSPPPQAAPEVKEKVEEPVAPKVEEPVEQKVEDKVDAQAPKEQAEEAVAENNEAKDEEKSADEKSSTPKPEELVNDVLGDMGL